MTISASSAAVSDAAAVGEGTGSAVSASTVLDSGSVGVLDKEVGSLAGADSASGGPGSGDPESAGSVGSLDWVASDGSGAVAAPISGAPRSQRA